MGLFKLLHYLLVINMAVLFFGSIWLMYKSFDLPTHDVKQVVNRAAAGFFTNDLDPQSFKKDIAQKFPFILPVERFPPMLLSTGGLKGIVDLLYTSLTEVLAIYHTPFETSGESGRHFMNISVTVMTGKVTLWDSRGEKSYGPSERYSYTIGEKYFVRMEKGTYILIHGRGLVPMSSCYWISDSLFSSSDPASAVLAVSYYVRAVYANWNISEYLESLWTQLLSVASGGVSYIPLAYEYTKEALVNVSKQLFQHGKEIL